MKRQVLTPTEAAVILGVSDETIRNLCRAGHIKAEKVGILWRVFKTDFYRQFKIPQSWKPIDGARFMTCTKAASELAISVRKIQEMCGVDFPAYKVARFWVIPIAPFKKKFKLA